MLTTRHWIIATALVLCGLVGVVIAEWTKTADVRLTDEPRPFGVETVVELAAGWEVTRLEGEEEDPEGWWRVSYTDDEGEMYEGWARSEAFTGERPSEEVLQNLTNARDPNYDDSYGAGSRGWTREIEDKKRLTDTEYDEGLDKLDAMKDFLDDRLVRPIAEYHAAVDQFYEGSDMAPLQADYDLGG